MPLDNQEGFFGAIAATVSAALIGFGTSHLKMRDRLKTSEVRMDVVEDKLDKIEETRDSVIRLECSMLGLEDDMKNSIRRQERIQKTITSIERMFKMNGDND